MPDTDFDTLRQDLELASYQPPFAAIRARRTRRIRRHAVLGVTSAAVAAAVIAGVAVWGSPPPRRDPLAVAAPAFGTVVDRVAIALESDEVYVLRGRCAAVCPADQVDTFSLVEQPSGDGVGASENLPSHGPVVAPQVGPLLAQHGTYFWYSIGNTIYSSDDGARTWHSDQVDVGAGELPGPASASGNIALLTIGGKLFEVVAGQRPTPVELPAGTDVVASVSAISGADQEHFFVAISAVVNGDSKVFLHEGDRWVVDRADPCPGEAIVESVDTIDVIDTSFETGIPQYVVCNDVDDATTYRTSLDGGGTWSAPASLGGTPAGWTAVINDSEPGVFAAWLAGTNGTILRVQHGAAGVSVTPPAVVGHVLDSFVAQGSFAAFADVTAARVYVTADGGRSWRFYEG